MHSFIFASANKHKIQEILAVADGKFNIITAAAAGIHEEIPETGTTLEENASIKARYIYERTGKNVFSDDSGLEVEALHGAPGIYSARYAGPGKNSEQNIELLLNQLTAQSNRNACFRTVICCILEGKEYIFEGRVEGTIVHSRRGTNGFGYDPVFQPLGSFKTFAELADSEKQSLSHRSRALAQLMQFLNT